MKFYKAKDYIDHRNYTIVKDGLYTQKELYNRGSSHTHHPTTRYPL